MSKQVKGNIMIFDVRGNEYKIVTNGKYFKIMIKKFYTLSNDKEWKDINASQFKNWDYYNSNMIQRRKNTLLFQNKYHTMNALTWKLNEIKYKKMSNIWTEVKI
jgi:hypothetical protein